MSNHFRGGPNVNPQSFPTMPALVLWLTELWMKPPVPWLLPIQLDTIDRQKINFDMFNA